MLVAQGARPTGESGPCVAVTLGAGAGALPVDSSRVGGAGSASSCEQVGL